jgi:hypothetical protein
VDPPHGNEPSYWLQIGRIGALASICALGITLAILARTADHDLHATVVSRVVPIAGRGEDGVGGVAVEQVRISNQSRGSRYVFAGMLVHSRHPQKSDELVPVRAPRGVDIAARADLPPGRSADVFFYPEDDGCALPILLETDSAEGLMILQTWASGRQLLSLADLTSNGKVRQFWSEKRDLCP